MKAHVYLLFLVSLCVCIVGCKPSKVWSRSSVIKKGEIQVEIVRVHFPNESPTIQIELSVKNLSAAKKMSFLEWSSASLDADSGSAILTDNNQNIYKAIARGVASEHAIYPEQSTSDILEFETPVKNIQWLHLELPAKNFGGSGMLRFEFSIYKIRAAMEEVSDALANQASHPFEASTQYSIYTNLDNQKTPLYWKARNAEMAGDQNSMRAFMNQMEQLEGQKTKIMQDVNAPFWQKNNTAQSHLAAAETNLESAPN